MARDLFFKHLMQELFPSYYVETLDLGPYNNVDYKPMGPLTENLISMFPKVIAVLQNLVMETWSIYLHRTRALMISSREMYVSHVMLISYVEDQIVGNIYDKFLMVLASVTHLAERINIATGMNFYELTPQILTVYFENALREDFNRSGGWKNLERHILSKKYNEIYNECVALYFATDEELQQKIREIVSPPRPYFEISIPSYENIKHPIIVKLTCQVMSFREKSPFNEPSLFTLYEKQPNSIQATETDPIRASEMDPIQTSEMDPIQTSEMDPIQTSEMDPIQTSEMDPIQTSEMDPIQTSEMDPIQTSEMDPIQTSEMDRFRLQRWTRFRLQRWTRFRLQRWTDSDFRDGPDSDFRDGSDSDFRDGSDSDFRDGSDSDFRDGSDSDFRDGSDSDFRDGSDSDFRDGLFDFRF
ncbi:uncharacterized protein TNCT_83781 [Trichonephila clavata]|uniref:Uncharacterized protein n=1 Tax=Trichonephila clavata TaxID=2740835 RepID=A0A8X6GPP8_TRICU|nr:uncharacterized protein TNCT_83781 [Trichonephila clavata]